jgi:hypothetical protein
MKVQNVISTWLVFIILFCFARQSQAQIRIMVQAFDVIETKKSGFFYSKNTGSQQALRAVPPHCINFLANNKKFSVIDRQNLSIIQAEKELQKSEEFMDGFIVEQGKSEGAEFVLKGIYFESEKLLTIKIYEISTGLVKCSVDETFETNMFGIKDFKSRIHNMMHSLMFDCFDIKFSMVRALETKKGEIKTALMAMGKKHGVKAGDRVIIKTWVSENVDGENVQRVVEIGEGEIELVQDENFSTVKIKKGGGELLRMLEAKEKIFGLIQNVID